MPKMDLCLVNNGHDLLDGLNCFCKNICRTNVLVMCSGLLTVELVDLLLGTHESFLGLLLFISDLLSELLLQVTLLL